MVTAGVMVKNRPVKVKQKRGGAESQVKTGESLCAEIKVSRATRIKDGEVKVLEKTFKGATTGGDDGVPPERMTTIEVANDKEGCRKAGKKGTKGIKVNRA